LNLPRGAPNHRAMASFNSLAGRMLIAMPGIDDPRFERAVILLCAHTDEHAMGLAVNRPVDGLTLPSLLERLGVESNINMPDDLVLFGGPVEKERGFVLHTDDYATPQSTVRIGAGIGLTATREVLEAIGDETLRPRKSVLALGYAGWDGGQLEHELQHNVWLTCDADESLVFGGDHEHKWGTALAKIGVQAERLSTLTGRA
jgi:putative transcriptional regulator